MTVNIIGGTNLEVDAYTIIRDELLKIKEPDIEISATKKRVNADVNYWLSIGTFRRACEVGDRGQTNLVLFNPYVGGGSSTKGIDHCVFQSKKYYHSFDVPNKYLIPTGIDPTLFKPNIKIGIAAIFREAKGGRILRELFNGGGLDNFTFYLCGGRWKEFFKIHPCQNINIRDLGFIPYNKMPDFYDSIDYLLILTPTSVGEGGPMTMIEALACGKPVITTDVGFANELDVKIFKTLEALRRILKNIEDERYAKYINQVKDFTWDNFRKKHVEVFRKLGA